MGSGSLIFLLFGSLVRNAGLWEPALWERARPAKGRQSRPAGSQRPCYCAASRRLWYPAGWLKPPFRGRGPLAQVATPPEVERQKKGSSRFSGNASPPFGAQVWVTPFWERREPVPGDSLSDVLSSRVPEGRHPDPLSSEPRRHGPLQRSVNRRTQR